MKVVITGASGNVGTGVLRALAADGDHEVVGICRRPPPRVPPFGRVTWHACDLGADTAPDALDEAVRGADAVVHTAWMFQPLRQGERSGVSTIRNTPAGSCCSSRRVRSSGR
ncbi:NAD(P)H-binding protein, partial [Actinosynnema sp. NPDC023658]|uniref:NAD(P)H-binding protein n=1 Tax=Actinosynnema sp. NPDC023658 TaxID=3155465 RepID=UPI0033C3D8A7